jgi:hypothetical protein
MVPVMELRRRQHPPQRTEAEAHVGVNEGRLDADEGDVGVERASASNPSRNSFE